MKNTSKTSKLLKSDKVNKEREENKQRRSNQVEVKSKERNNQRIKDVRNRSRVVNFPLSVSRCDFCFLLTILRRNKKKEEKH